LVIYTASHPEIVPAGSTSSSSEPTKLITTALWMEHTGGDVSGAAVGLRTRHETGVGVRVQFQ